MGFNKYYIPAPQDFINHLEKDITPSYFVAIKKIDAVVGDSLSIKMLNKVYELVDAGLTNADIIAELKLMLK